MRALLVAALLAAGSASAGDLVARNKETGAELRLLDSPCVNAETLMQLGEEWRPKFRALKILNAKGHIAWFGCWIKHEEDSVYVLLQDGAEMLFDLTLFSDPNV